MSSPTANTFSIKDYGILDALNRSIQEDIRQGKFIFWEDVIYLWYDSTIKCYFTATPELESVPTHYSKIMWGFFIPTTYSESEITYRFTLLNSVYNLELSDSDIEQLTSNILENDLTTFGWK